ncbi:Peptidase S8 and S53, subtilisin, kexin, sedolisin (fragment) [Candidatus Sulfopaludibacter sp. SbA3]
MSVPLNFVTGSPQWTASVSPANLTSKWLTVTPTLASGSSPVNLQANTAGLSPGVYTAVVSIQAVDALPQVVNVPVTLVVGGSSTTQITAVSNAFSGGATAAPGMFLSVYGAQLANATAQATQLPLPLSMSGVSATVNGFSAPLYYVSPGQINLQVPYEAGAGPAMLAINNNGQIAAFPFQVAAAAPGLLPTAYDNSTGAPVSTAQAGGDGVLLLFMTGEGDVTPTLATGATPSSTVTDPTKLPHSRLPLTMTIGGVSVTPLFAGIPSGLVAETQIDFQVPAGVPAGKQPVVVTVGGVSANTIFLNIQ